MATPPLEMMVDLRGGSDPPLGMMVHVRGGSLDPPPRDDGGGYISVYSRIFKISNKVTWMTNLYSAGVLVRWFTSR